VNRRRLLALLLLAALGRTSTAGAAAPAPWPVPTSGTTWYRLSLLGQPAGYMSSDLRLIHDEQGAEVLQEDDRQVINFSVTGQALRLTEDVVTVYARDLRPLRWDVRLDKMGQTQEITAHLEGKTLQISSVEAGQRTDQTLPLPADFSGDLRIYADVLQGALKPGETRTVSAFIPEVGALDTETITVGQPETLPVAGQAERCTPLVVTAQKVGSEIHLWLNEQGEVVKYALPTLMNAQAEEVSQTEALRQFAPLVLADSLALDKTLPQSTGLTRLVLNAAGLGQAAADLIPAGPRQEVVPGPDNTARVTLRAQAPPAHSVPLPVTAPGMEQYLKSTPMAQSDDPKLQALAHQIVGGETDSYRAALLISNWVYHNLGAMASDPRPITALQVLAQGKGDCTDHALLMATLGRVVGLPTRMVSGLAAIGDHMYYHAWVEAYVGAWVEIDPTWGEAGVDAGHLATGRSALDEVSFARMSLDTGRTLGALSLSVVEWQ
jgi:hypothetical protein